MAPGDRRSKRAGRDFRAAAWTGAKNRRQDHPAACRAGLRRHLAVLPLRAAGRGARRARRSSRSQEPLRDADGVVSLAWRRWCGRRRTAAGFRRALPACSACRWLFGTTLETIPAAVPYLGGPGDPAGAGLAHLVSPRCRRVARSGWCGRAIRRLADRSASAIDRRPLGVSVTSRAARRGAWRDVRDRYRKARSERTRRRRRRRA